MAIIRRLSYLLPLLLVACTSSGGNKTTNSSNQSQTEEIISDDNVVSSSIDYFSRDVERKEMWVLGRSYKTKPEALKTLYIATSRLVTNVVTENKWIMTGSIMAIYEELPSPHKEIEIFVGVPVNNKKEIEGFKWKKIPAGKYIKATTNYGLGESAAAWQSIHKDLTERGKNLAFPVYEYPSDSRNREMTTVVSQCNLLFPKSK